MTHLIQTYSDLVRSYLELNVALAPLIAIILRTLSVVIAPIPGTPIDLISLAFFTKMAGFVYAEISIMLGSCINFFIARKFGEPVVSKFIDVSKIRLWEQRINEKSGFWGLVFIRMLTILIFDFLSYVAGLTRMSFPKFFITSLLASIPPVGAFYYFGGILIDKQLFIIIILIVPIWTMFSMFKRGKIFKRFHDYLNLEGNMEKLNYLIKGDGSDTSNTDKKIMQD